MTQIYAINSTDDELGTKKWLVTIISTLHPYPFPKRQILDSSKLRVCRQQFQILWKWQQVIQRARKHWEKNLLITSNFSFSHSVFKRLVLQTHKNQGLFWN